MRSGTAREDAQITVETQSTATGERALRVLTLVWIHPTGLRAHALREPRHVLGRGADADVVLDSPSVSRRHAEIYRQGPIFAIRDLGSTNGIFLDGQRAAHAALKAGQVMRIGDFVGVLVALEAAAIEDAGSFREIGPGLFGGARLAQALEPLKRAAAHDLPVILQGETGTGKERVARTLHAWSGREGPFYAVNCAALPSAMIEGKLFGYRKGAFTGAAQNHAGHLRSASGGTLFLDEIVELPLDMQAKLLRALQEREVIPLGENRAVPIDVRVVSACQAPLRDAVQRGAFRADLHARLSGYVSVLPPLRERPEDVAHLFVTFVKRQSGGRPPSIEAKLIEQLCLYAWPDNVRELELLARRLLILHGHEPVLRRSFLPDHVNAIATESAPPDPVDEGEDRRTHDLRRLVAALRKTDGNLTKAVASLGISRQRAYRLMGDRTTEQLLASSLDLADHESSGS